MGLPGGLFATALALSIGWGIRGNFGHEYGAMIPGAMAAMVAALFCGREDWWRRVAHFGFFGALGWSFGGSISYMMVIAYTHSGHSPSVLYGFACLFVIGFLWGAIGGAGTAIPACLEAEEMASLYPPILTLFAAWMLQDVAVGWIDKVSPDHRHESLLYWFDTDWLAALLALATMGVYCLVRRRFDAGASLIVHMALGWWAGFLGLVVLLGWRMTPPRGDNWAGCLGMVGGLWVFLARRGQWGVLWASITVGFAGGLGFSGATLFKLLEVKSGLDTNWHSVLEQSYGFINGLGVGVALFVLAKRTPTQAMPRKRWTQIVAVLFVLIGITYLNLAKNPADWAKAKTMPAAMLGLTNGTWFALGYSALAALVLAALLRHLKRPLPLLQASPLARAQWLVLIFLWWMVIGNFERAVVAFAPQRLVTEGVIHLNAVLLSALALLAPPVAVGIPTRLPLPSLTRRALQLGLAGMVLAVAVEWATVRLAYGDQFAGHASKHIRFGPDATTQERKPKPGQPHP